MVLTKFDTYSVDTSEDLKKGQDMVDKLEKKFLDGLSG